MGKDTTGTISIETMILEFIINNPGKKAREIAGQLGIDKSEVNHFLYGSLKEQLISDDKYGWYIKENAPSKAKADSRIQKTPLSNLCRYYLACLGQDDEGGVSVFANNKFDDFDYTELTVLPTENGEIEHSEKVQKLVSKIRKDKSRLEMYFGYPTTLKKCKSKKSGWEGYFVEPIFLFPVEIQDGVPKVSQSFPLLNQSVLKRFTNSERDQIMEELVQLENELGLTSDKDIPEIDDLAKRLESVRPEYPWKEKINPNSLSNDRLLKDIQDEGIYNKAVLVVGERSPYTQGLESELKTLSELPVEDYANTALGQWVNENIYKNEVNDEQPLLEVLPLNSEQRQAIHQSLSNNLTIITGPPGTGKSQVVTNLLINAAWRGKKVLFASKNNKAVDVVEVRVNNIGSQPIMLRVGSNEHQNKLAEYLIGLLSSTCSENDFEEFGLDEQRYKLLEEKCLELDKEEAELVRLRNETDELDKSVEKTRNLFSAKIFEQLKLVNRPLLESKIKIFKMCLLLADKSKQNLIIQLFWGFTGRSRVNNLRKSLGDIKEYAMLFDLKGVDEREIDGSLIGLYSLVEKLELYFLFAQNISEYLSSLKLLQQTRSLEDILREKTDVTKQMAKGAENLWRGWLKLQPSRISNTDRQTLSKYKTMLKMVVESSTDVYKSLGGKIYKEYIGLANKVAHLLPAWAVTSLSAKGKIPFVPGYFDIVIFDEASQCDIASALPLLYRAKQAVIIGDPKQLSHISGIQREQDKQLLEKFDLIPHFANWAFSYNSLFDLASGYINGNDIISLRDHHRSHADIIEFSNEEFYGGDLRVATNYDNLKFVDLNDNGIRWVDVSGKASRPANGGAENEIEAKEVVKEITKLIIDRKYPGTIGVVTPFRAQANLIRRLVNDNTELSSKLINNDFLVDTVHKFQGDERDVMIFSPVVSKNMPIGALGFLRNNGNLFNVAITRARAMLLVVGDLKTIAKCEVTYLAHFAKYVQNLSEKREKEVVNKVVDLGPDYPTVSEPEKVSEWEHVFYKALYEAGIKLIPQFRVEKYILDFALFDGKRMLNVEVDGERYHKNWTGDLCRRDQIRNQRLYELGWDVKRFWVYEVRDDIAKCIKTITDWSNQNV